MVIIMTNINYIDDFNMLTPIIGNGLVIMNCDGKPEEWITRLCAIFENDAVIKQGFKFANIYVFKLQNNEFHIVFPLHGMNVAKLAVQRIKYSQFICLSWYNDLANQYMMKGVC